MTPVKIKIDSYEAEVSEGIPLIDAVRESGFWIPGLCHHPDLNPVGICGLCVVEIDGFDSPQLACMVRTTEGMNIRTDSPNVWGMRREALRRILSEHPHGCLDCEIRFDCDRVNCARGTPEYDRCCNRFDECELRMLVDWMGLPENTPPYEPKGIPRLTDQSVFFRDYNLCISCTRCARACRTFEGHDVYRNYFPNGHLDQSRIKPLEDPDCSFCGFCIDSCPTGALSLLDTDFGYLGYFPIGTAGRMSIVPPPPTEKINVEDANIENIPKTPGRITLYDSNDGFVMSKRCRNLRECFIELRRNEKAESFTLQSDY